MSHLDTSATRELDRVDFPAGLRELVRLRASQLNGCAYCVDMHATDAASAGEPAQRINAVAIWHESPFFTDRERAALGFTEAVTLVADTRVPPEEYDAVAAHWSPDEVGALLALIVDHQRLERDRRRDPRVGAGPGRLSRRAEPRSGLGPTLPAWTSTSASRAPATAPPASTRPCATPCSTAGWPRATGCRPAASWPRASVSPGAP